MKQSVNWKSLKGNITVSLIYHINSRRTVSKEKFVRYFPFALFFQPIIYGSRYFFHVFISLAKTLVVG